MTNDLHENWDAVVVGAGPAGSTTAGKIASHGFRTLLLEEHLQVGTPLHCSGLVSPRTIDAGQIDRSLIVNEVKGAIVHTSSGKSLVLGGDKTRAYALDRIALDRQLTARAVSSGAELNLDSRLIEIQRDNNSIRLLCRNHLGEMRTITTNLVIGADGCRSAVASWIGVPPAESVACVSATVRLDSHPTDMVQVFVGSDLAPGWFGWTIPTGGNMVRVGIGTQSGSIKPRHALDNLMAAFPKIFSGAEIQSYNGGFIPAYADIKPFSDNALLVGDAARQVKPFSGGGIYLAMVAAGLAAETAVNSLKTQSFSEEALSQYGRDCEKQFGHVLKQGEEIKKVYLSLSQRNLDQLLDILKLPVLRSVISRHGDIDMPFTMFSSLLKAAPVFRWALSLSSKIPSTA